MKEMEQPIEFGKYPLFGKFKHKKSIHFSFVRAYFDKIDFK